ncbi:hypothetical protein [Halopiger djelfimassiliensis]|uniref:hypothetical protein n=1 Tax=Halopiger djelfimassiliensis TaxID=1293047 RepID=UPI0006781303|nr:hypothetical protein [Halopiger djelfimassiliensis]
MRRSSTALGIAALGGLVNAGTVLALYARGDYPALESTGWIAVLVTMTVVLGFLPVFVSAYTRLLTPAVGWIAVFAGTVVLEVRSPMPEWGRLGEYVVVDGPTYVSSYATAWYVWLALLSFVGVVEFAVRRGYGIGDGRLRNLPTLPLSRRSRRLIGGGAACLVGLATTLLVVRTGIDPTVTAVVVFLFTVAVTAVPLAAVLGEGIVTPTVLFTPVLYALVYEVFLTTGSPVYLLLFGPYALVLVAVWKLEAGLRARLGGWNGGRFTGR